MRVFILVNMVEMFQRLPSPICRNFGEGQNHARRQKGLYVMHVVGRDAQIAKKKKKAVFT
jgi:hypothetical protein